MHDRAAPRTFQRLPKRGIALPPRPYIHQTIRVASNRKRIIEELTANGKCPGTQPGVHEHYTAAEAKHFPGIGERMEPALVRRLTQGIAKTAIPPPQHVLVVGNWKKKPRKRPRLKLKLRAPPAKSSAEKKI